MRASQNHRLSRRAPSKSVKIDDFRRFPRLVHPWRTRTHPEVKVWPQVAAVSVLVVCSLQPVLTPARPHGHRVRGESRARATGTCVAARTRVHVRVRVRVCVRVCVCMARARAGNQLSAPPHLSSSTPSNPSCAPNPFASCAALREQRSHCAALRMGQGRGGRQRATGHHR
jgi:hypothetical protein